MRDDDDRACGVMDDLAAYRAHHEPAETAAATRADHYQVGVMRRIDEFPGRKAALTSTRQVDSTRCYARFTIPLGAHWAVIWSPPRGCRT